MELGSLLLGLALLLVVAFIVARPLLEEQGVRTPATNEAERWLAEREAALAALLDLDFDHATGKVADDDYAAQRAQLVARGAAALRALDALGVDGRERPEDEIERVVAARRGRAPSPPADLEAVVEAQVAARRAASSARRSSPAAARRCTQCSQPAGAQDKFCAKCGAELPTAHAGAAQ